jgi:hypothetical protein
MCYIGFTVNFAREDLLWQNCVRLNFAREDLIGHNFARVNLLWQNCVRFISEKKLIPNEL